MIKEGETVTPSAAALLAKLDYRPFSYNMKVVSVYDDGIMLSSDIISMTPDDYAVKFCECVKTLNAISM